MKFSPDGQTIVFTARGGNFNIWTVPSSGGTAEPLIDSAADCWGPSWSPDGTQLAFVSRGEPEGGSPWYVWLLFVESGETTKLAKGIFPVWSPNDDEITFVQGTDIWKVAASGGAPARLLTFDDDAPRHAWSPDGSQILFIHRAAGRGLLIADVSNPEMNGMTLRTKLSLLVVLLAVVPMARWPSSPTTTQFVPLRRLWRRDRRIWSLKSPLILIRSFRR